MASVGQKLKDARIAKGLTLDDLQQTTKIQKRYLIAIEENNYDALPGKFYVKAFARQYAETVGLNPNEIIQELDQELGLPSSPEEQEETTSRVQKREELTRPEDNSLSAKIAKYLPTIIVVVVVVAILGTIYAVAWGNHEKAKNQQIEQTNTKVAVSTDVKKPAKKSKSTEESSSSEKKKQKIVNVASSGSTFTYNVENAPSENTIEIGASSGSSWDAVYIGGASSWQGTLQAGSTKKIQVPAGTTQVILSIGNSNASTVKINGHKLNFLEQNSTLTVRKLVLNFTNGDSSSTQSTTQTQTQGQTTTGQTGTTNQTNNGYTNQRYQQNNGQTTNNYRATR